MTNFLPICCALFVLLLFGCISGIQQHAFGESVQDLAARLGGNSTGIYYPLYSMDELPQVLAAKKMFPSVPFNVNINPASGPGTGTSEAISDAIKKLKDAGAVVTGYVPTGYGTGKNASQVESMISAYDRFYPHMLDGIMFDEVSGSCAEFDFYKTVTNYARSLGYSYIRANVGGPACQSEIPLFNQTAVYEGAGYPSESILASNTFYPKYSKDAIGFGATIHTEKTYDPRWLAAATKYLKWVYITDQAEPNPYATFPSYFDQYLSDLAALSMNRQATPEFGPFTPMALTISVIAVVYACTLLDKSSRRVDLGD